jgi:hypothetical protein
VLRRLEGLDLSASRNKELGRRFGVWIGLGVGLAAAAVYSTQLFAPFDPDGATVVGEYIHHPGLAQIFHTNIAYNNHVLFTFVEKLVYLASGANDGEAVLRIVPIGAAAASVALLTAAVARRWGALAGIAAGVLLASNPLFASRAWAIRGYSMLVLFALASTLVLLRMLRAENPTRLETVAYIALAAAGTATHLFMIPVIVLQAALVVARGQRSGRWATTFALALGFGLVPYTWMAKKMVTDRTPRRFTADYPARLGSALLGGTGATIAVTAALLVIAALALGWRREWIFLGIPALATVLFYWVIEQPIPIGTHYFIWALPAVAVGCAYGARRYPALLLAIAAVVVLQAWPQVSDWNTPALAEKPAGAIVQHQHNIGRLVCTVGYGDGPLYGYTKPGAFTPIPTTDVRGLTKCDDVVILLTTDIPRSMLTAVDGRYPDRLRIPAREPTTIYSLHPIPN